jgi:hypothetical protein
MFVRIHSRDADLTKGAYFYEPEESVLVAVQPLGDNSVAISKGVPRIRVEDILRIGEAAGIDELELIASDWIDWITHRKPQGVIEPEPFDKVWPPARQRRILFACEIGTLEGAVYADPPKVLEVSFNGPEDGTQKVKEALRSLDVDFDSANAVGR